MKRFLPALAGLALATVGSLSLFLPEREFIVLLRIYTFAISIAVASVLIYLTYALVKVPPPPDPRELEREYREELERVLRELGGRP